MPRAAHAGPGVDRQAWAATGAVGPAQPQPGHLYVSSAGGKDQARVYLHVDGGGLVGDGLSTGTVGLVEASDALLPERAALIACAATTPVAIDGQMSGPAPAADCSKQTPLTRATDGSWSLPLHDLASHPPGATGTSIVIMPDPQAAPSVFTVAFDSSRTRLGVPAGAVAPTSAPAPTDGPAAAAAAVPAGTAPSAGSDTPAVASSQALSPPTAAAAVLPAGAAPVHLPLGGRRPADRPFALLIVLPVLASAAGVWGWSRLRPNPVPPAVVVPAAVLPGAGATAAALVVFGLLSETLVYKLGLVAIVFVAAIGLHLLVNWCGELSLAHAGFIGVPAFAVAQLSSHTGLTPILGLPLGVTIGVALGAIVGLAALRSRGLQVALVTLAIAIAIGQFFFFRTWLVGPNEGLSIPIPSLFGHQLATSRSLAPVLAATVALAVVVARWIMQSTIGRAFMFVRTDPDAASAAGIAVARYRALAYAIAGGFAGLAGWAYVVWVQQVSAKAFPLQLGFTYLVLAALAGRGGLGGVAVAAFVIQGGTIFSFVPHSVALYLAPIALIITVTRYQQGLNGSLRTVARTLRNRIGGAMHHPREQARAGLRLGVLAGTAAIVAGFSAIGLSWYHLGNTDQVWIQNQELVSGGVFGLGLIVVGSALLLRDALLHRAMPAAIGPVLEPAVPLEAQAPAAAPARRRRSRAAASEAA